MNQSNLPNRTLSKEISNAGFKAMLCSAGMCAAFTFSYPFNSILCFIGGVCGLYFSAKSYSLNSKGESK